ncbi:MAG TPA: imidazolonepropionase [Acidobacteriota bacterium]|nr:imidazolonepropionase [Acidobacteriota bacterium]
MLVIKNIAQVVTLQGCPVPRVGDSMAELGIIENGAILVRGERIVWVGPTRDLPPNEKNVQYELLDGIGLDLIALPGFVDGHTHPIFGGTRAEEYDLRSRGKSYQEIAAAGGGIAASVRQLRAATVEQLVERAERHFRHFLWHGTTTIEAKSGYGLSLEHELKMLEAISRLRTRSRLETVPTFLGAHDVPAEFKENRREYVRRIVEEMIPRVAREGLAQFCDVFCDDGYFSVEEARIILRAAKEAGLGLRVHADELSHSGGAKLAAELGARSADHLEWIDDKDVELLKKAGTVATLLPGTAFNLGLQRYPPARKLISSGVPVALATDFNPGSCFSLNMQLVLSLACSQMKMSPDEAIAAATINGAYSLGLSERLGSLEAGKQADIVLMDVADYRELPYFFGVNHCVATVKKGNILITRLEKA